MPKGHRYKTLCDDLRANRVRVCYVPILFEVKFRFADLLEDPCQM